MIFMDIYVNVWGCDRLSVSGWINDIAYIVFVNVQKFIS